MLRVKEITIDFFEQNIYDKYVTLFAKEEQREWKTIKEIYNKGYEKFYGIYDDNNLIGFFMLERINNYPYYLDYFAIFKEYQSKGYGSKSIEVLIRDVVKNDGIIGEIEKVNEDDPITIRRWKFYEKLGFKKFDDIDFVYTVVFNIIVYPGNINYSSREIANILVEYYKTNIGEKETERIIRVIDVGDENEK